MRIVICGDTHIGAYFGFDRRDSQLRIDDFEKTLNHIVDYCISTKVDMFIQTGDAFEERSPTPECIAIFNQALLRLSSANILTAVIMGNHDFLNNGETFNSCITNLPAKNYSNVRLVLHPEVVKIENSSGERANIILLPYRDKFMYSAQTIDEKSKQYEEEIKNLISETDSDPKIVVGHNFFYEGSFSLYGAHELLVNPSVFSDCDLVVMGHQHGFRPLRKEKPILIYSGSMEKMNFGDKDTDKVFIDYSVIEKKARVLKIPSRQMTDETIDLSAADITTYKDLLWQEIDKLKVQDKIVRLKVILKENFLPTFNKNEIEKKLYDDKAYYVSAVIAEVVYKKIVRDEAVLNNKDDFSIFKAFIESQGFPEDLKNILLKESEPIIKDKYSEDED